MQKKAGVKGLTAKLYTVGIELGLVVSSGMHLKELELNYSETLSTDSFYIAWHYPITEMTLMNEVK